MPHFKHNKLLKTYTIIPFIIPLITAIYVIYELTIARANIIYSKISELLATIPIPMFHSILLYPLSPYTIGTIGLIIVSLSIYTGKFSRAAITLTMVYLYNVIFTVNAIDAIPLYITGLVILLISYNWARGFHIPPARIVQGKLKLILLVALEYMLLYFLVLMFSTWYTRLLSHILYTLPSKLPYPLSMIYSNIMETRIGILIITIITFYTLIWLINQFIETILLNFTLTRNLALDIAKNELSQAAKKVLVIESYGVMDYAASFLILIPLYPIILSRVVEFLKSYTIYQDQSYVTIIVHSISFLVYIILARLIKGIFKSIAQGSSTFRMPLIFSLALAVLILLLYVLNGYNLIDVITSFIRGSPIAYDPLKEYILKFEEEVRSIENYVKYFEELSKLIIRIIWG